MGGRDLKAVRGTDVCYIPVYSEGANPRIDACLCEIRDEGVSICLVAAVEESCYVRCGGRAGSAQTEIAYITRTLTASSCAPVSTTTFYQYQRNADTRLAS